MLFEKVILQMKNKTFLTKKNTVKNNENDG